MNGVGDFAAHRISGRPGVGSMQMTLGDGVDDPFDVSRAAIAVDFDFAIGRKGRITGPADVIIGGIIRRGVIVGKVDETISVIIVEAIVKGNKPGRLAIFPGQELNGRLHMSTSVDDE